MGRRGSIFTMVTAVVLAVVLAASALAGCDLRAGSKSVVFDSTGPRADRELVAPQYVAVVAGGLVARRGEVTRRIENGTDSVWLDDGRLIYNQAYAANGFRDNMRTLLLEPATGHTRRLSKTGAVLPDQALWGIVIGGGDDEYVQRSPDLKTSTQLTVPSYRPHSDDEARDVGDPVVMHDATLLRYSVYDEEGTSDYGYYLVRDGRTTRVLRGKRLIALWVSTDGRALLGLQQVRGDPCGGCEVNQQVVEIDPSDATIVRTYGVPEGYDKTWRVERIDKVNGQIAVQYLRRYPSAASREVGTFRLDGDGRWSKVSGSDRVLTWWQGRDDRIEARLTGATLAHARLWWVHDGRSTRLPGDLSRDGNLGYPSVPGGLLRPAG